MAPVPGWGTGSAGGPARIPQQAPVRRYCRRSPPRCRGCCGRRVGDPHRGVGESSGRNRAAAVLWRPMPVTTGGWQVERGEMTSGFFGPRVGAKSDDAESDVPFGSRLERDIVHRSSRSVSRGWVGTGQLRLQWWDRRQRPPNPRGNDPPARSGGVQKSPEGFRGGLRCRGRSRRTQTDSDEIG